MKEVTFIKLYNSIEIQYMKYMYILTHSLPSIVNTLTFR